MPLLHDDKAAVITTKLMMPAADLLGRYLTVAVIYFVIDSLAVEAVNYYIDHRTKAIAISHVMFHNGQHNDLADIIAFATARAIVRKR